MSVNVWLADLCYTQQIVSAELTPTAVGGIATFLESSGGPTPSIRLFKYPEKLIEALEEEGAPHILGLSNYCWNINLSYGFAEAIKKSWPDTVVVFGGPNYPIDAPSQEEFLRAYPAVDFYINKEGEVPFAAMVNALIEHGFDVEAVKKLELGGVHGIANDGSFVAPEVAKRIRDLTEIPSPFLTGWMDEFFDGTLMPLLQTKRGCPFSCTFCTEGILYFNKVYKNSQEKLEAEFDYIGKRMLDLRHLGGRNDLFIADSNFGMFKDDLDTCRLIRDVKEKYGWPEYIKCSTGKNNRDRVLAATRIVDGAIALSGSVQSLDPEVLENIKRKNIDAQQLMDLALEAAEAGANSYAEVILALPGDTAEKHMDTARALIEAEFTNLYLFQLMLLPGTDLYTPEVRERYEMNTHFRVLPRCFGDYAIGDQHRIVTAEIEEIVTSTNTLPFSDYLACRKFDLMVTIFFNDAVFQGILKLLRHLGVSRYSWIRGLFEHEFTGPLADTIDAFIQETEGELWESQEELMAFVSKPENVEKYLNDELGANLLYKYQAIVVNDHLHQLAEAAQAAAKEVIEAEGLLTPKVGGMVEDIINFEVLRREGMFKGDYDSRQSALRHDVAAFMDAPTEASLEEFTWDEPQTVEFAHDQEQIDTIERAFSAYGRSNVGLTRIMVRFHVKSLLRRPTLKQEAAC